MEAREKRLGFFVGLGRRRNGNVHTTDRIDLVVFDFRENDLFFEADVVVAAAVKGTARHTAEVADAREGDGHQAVKEVDGKKVRVFKSNGAVVGAKA